MLPTLLIAFLPVPQALPEGLPHPDHVVYAHVQDEDGELPEAPAGRLWQALRPRWADPNAAVLLAAADHHELATFVTSRNRWQPRGMETWLELTRPAPVPLRFQLRDAASGEVLAEGRRELEPGRPGAFRELRRRLVILDFDVEIAQAAAIADPVMGDQYAGSSVALELLPVPGQGYQAEIAFVESGFGPREAIDTGYEAIQGADRLHGTLAEAGLTTLLQPGRSARILLPGAGRPLELILELGGAMPPASFGAGEGILCCAAPTLAAVPELWAGLLAELEQRDDTWFTGSGYLAFAGEAAIDQVEAVGRACAEQARRAQLSLRVAVVGGGQAGELLRLESEVLLDQPLRFARGGLARALTDWDVEVAQNSRIADPRFRTFFDGIQGELVPAGDGAVDLDLRLTRVAHGDPAFVTISRALPGFEGTGGALPADLVAIERPEEAALAVTGSFRCDARGALRLERRALSYLGAGALLVVEIQVTPLD